jgi:putative ABC transport system permease protein
MALRLHPIPNMRTFLQDLRYGLRMLAKSPGFTAAALLTLTLGIGATAAIFSVVDAVLLRALPFRDPSRLVAVYEDVSHWGFPRNTPAPGNYADFKAQTQVFEDVAASAFQVYNLSGKGEDPEKLEGQSATHNLFSLLGVAPELGRVFTADEDRPGFQHVVLLSHDLWTRRFGADRKAIGREILLNNEKYSVIGVLPAGFHFEAKNEDIWTPMAFPAEQLLNRGTHYLNVVARLQPGVSVEKANASLQVLLKTRAQQYPEDLRVMDRFFAEPLQVSYTYEVRSGLKVLIAAVGFILLIACANIANLLLSRAAGRQRELAVRTALGANRARLVRQLLTESTLMALGGGALGILLADWCFVFLKNLIPEDLSRMIALTLDFRVLAFAVAVSLASSVLFGLAPALQISGIDLNEVLKQGGRGNTGPRRSLFRSALVIGEVALSLVLLVGSGLMIESFANLRGLNPGFRADHVLTMRLEVPDTKYGNFARRTQFFQNVLERVRTIPGVQVAGFTSALPLTFKGGTSRFTPEHVVLPQGLSNDANNRVVSPGYFEAMRIPLRRGRFFDEHDGALAAPVVLINETMARKFWRNQDALGRRMQLHADGPWFQIVGIVADVRQMGLNEPPRQEMYFSYWQAEKNWFTPRDLAIRTAGDPTALVKSVKRTIASIDRDQPISDIKTMDQWLDEEVASRHVQTTLLGGFAALALILACIGIYGVLAYVVTQRTQEIGVRVALGADSGSIFRAVAKQGMSLAAAGIAIGVAASLALSRGLESMLFDVKPTDPLTYLGAALVFAFVSLLACYIPARRAAKVDPLVALRYE